MQLKQIKFFSFIFFIFTSMNTWVKSEQVHLKTQLRTAKKYVYWVFLCLIGLIGESIFWESLKVLSLINLTTKLNKTIICGTTSTEPFCFYQFWSLILPLWLFQKTEPLKWVNSPFCVDALCGSSEVKDRDAFSLRSCSFSDKTECCIKWGVLKETHSCSGMLWSLKLLMSCRTFDSYFIAEIEKHSSTVYVFKFLNFKIIRLFPQLYPCYCKIVVSICANKVYF